MINNISNWAEQIIVAVIIGTILEMILPNGNSKKYVRTLIGIYVLYTIVSPIVSFATGKDFKIDYSDYNKYFNNVKIGNNIDEINAKTLEDIYKTEIRNQIKKDIEDRDFTANNISFNIDLETGIITNVELSIKKEKSTKNSNIAINKIEIGSTKENTLTKQEIDELKEFLNTNYGIEYKEIKINSI